MYSQLTEGLISMTRKFVYFLSLLVLMTTVVQVVQAHPGGHEHEGAPANSRTWTLAESGAHVHGAFVSAKEGKTQVRRDDGRLMTLAIDQLTAEDQRWLAARQAEIRKSNEQPPAERLLVFAPDLKPNDPAVQMAKAFEPYAKLKTINYRFDDRYAYVESIGIPDHPMMVGITSW